MRRRMDWRTIRFDWNHARAFLVAAEEGSFSAAARALRTTQPTVGRQVAALEEALDVTLFERGGRRLELTESGLELIEHVRGMGALATQVSLAAAGQAASIEGPVCITASEVVARFLLPPVVADLRRDHPGIEIEVVASNAIRDLRRREADIAIRNVRPDQRDLFSRRLRDAEVGLYATPAYLDRVGRPAAGPRTEPLDVIGFDEGDGLARALSSFGLSVASPVIAANQLVQWGLCLAGAGIAVMMCDVADSEPRIERVLPEVAMPIPLWLVCHRELRTSRRFRLVFDRLAGALLSTPGST